MSYAIFFARSFAHRGALLLSLGSFLFTSGALAQGTLLEEVIVTAQKREESLQDVPIAISALTGDQLSELGVATPNDLMNVFPNLILKPGSALNTGFSIRGVGTDNFHVTAQQAVGQYLDEVSLISPIIGSFGLFDMERVEVLRGPQNTLFGRNTTGGAVSMISRKPEVGGELNGYGRVNGGNEGRIDFEGAVGVPLGESAAARLAVQTKNRGAIYNNLLNGEDTGEEERHSGRAQLAFEPSESFRVLANGHFTLQRGDRLPFRGIGLLDSQRLAAAGLLDADGNIRADAGETAGGLLNPARGLRCSRLADGTAQYKELNTCVTMVGGDHRTLHNISSADWQDVWDGAPNTSNLDFYGGFLRLEYDFPSFTATSISSYDEVQFNYIENTGGQAYAGFFPGQDAEYKAFQQEVRLTSTHEGPWRWIFGGYYSSEDDTLATIIRNGSPGTPPFSVIPSIEIQQDVDIYSVYGKIDIDLTERLTLFGGLRWTQDSKEGISIARIAPGTESGQVGSPRLPDDFYTDLARLRAITAGATGGCPPPPLPCQSPDLPVKQDIKELGGKIGFNLQFNDAVMGYVSFARGFKSGAFDTRALAAFAGTADKPVGPEFLNAFEVGMKSELLDGALQFNAAVFRYDWEDLQIFDVDSQGRPAFLNVPETEIVGAEVDFKWAPGAGWFVSGGLGYLHSEIKDDGGLANISTGARLNHTPEITFNGLILKEFQAGDGLVTLQTDFRYSDEFNSSANEEPGTVTSEAFFINARASYRFGNEQQYEVSVWGENLSAEKTCYDISNNETLTVANGCTPNPGMAFFGGTFQIDF